VKYTDFYTELERNLSGYAALRDMAERTGSSDNRNNPIFNDVEADFVVK